MVTHRRAKGEADPLEPRDYLLRLMPWALLLVIGLLGLLLLPTRTPASSRPACRS